ncbi:MAG: hypothetical protein J6S85_04445 [Methanobrevibacter sp.]|nr:hypothetical protein [Methanobrevibacter sp.]MBO7712795.1 hypothetical protein [Methanobrevibacter sp.]
MKKTREKAIDKNILEANIKLIDENKDLKQRNNTAIEYIEYCLEKDLRILNIEKLINILKGTVE